jgi:hypothetical protein
MRCAWEEQGDCQERDGQKIVGPVHRELLLYARP